MRDRTVSDDVVRRGSDSARRLVPRAASAMALATAIVLAVPVTWVAGHLALPLTATGSELLGSVIPSYALTTAALLVLVLAGSLAIGVPAAWLVATCRFPFRDALGWLLALPLAVPAYILAWVYFDLLSSSGPVREAIRAATGMGPRDYWFPQVASLPGAAAILTLALYPYVYLAARAAFAEMSAAPWESARMLGCEPAEAFRRIALPLARPAIVAGAALVAMETVGDFGTVSFLGVPTIASGIYRAWFSQGDRIAATQLAAMLLLAIAGLLLLERILRGGRRHANPSEAPRPAAAIVLEGRTALLATLACALPALLGFLLPAGRLLWLALGPAAVLPDARFVALLVNSVALALVVALLAVALALLLLREPGAASPLDRAVVGVVGLGYAVPGPVVAVGVLAVATALDRALDGVLGGATARLWLTGSFALLVYACLVRYLAVALGPIRGGLERIAPSLGPAARTLGAGRVRRLVAVTMPLAAPSLAAAGLLVFVDILKELPITFVLRPFDFDTLAVRTYNLARDERFTAAAAPALVLVAIGLLPAILLSRRMRQQR